MGADLKTTTSKCRSCGSTAASLWSICPAGVSRSMMDVQDATAISLPCSVREVSPIQEPIGHARLLGQLRGPPPAPGPPGLALFEFEQQPGGDPGQPPVWVHPPVQHVAKIERFHWPAATPIDRKSTRLNSSHIPLS